MGRVLGTIAAVLGWIGWLTICPALGFPTLGTAAMVNRLLAPREDPGFWLGWAVVLIGLVSAALLYLAAADRGRLRPTVALGAAYGVICWLLAGAILMPLLALADPTAATPPAAPALPDPMRPSFMMLHLGLGAPIAALIAWVVFGAVLGAASAKRDQVRQVFAFRPGLGAALLIVVVAAIGLAVARPTVVQTGPSVAGARTLASGPVAALPEGASFFSIVALPQAPGGRLGPHAHFAGFAYSLKGVQTMTLGDGRTIRVGPGEGGFIGAQRPHTHLNVDDLAPAAVLALLIVGLAGALSAIAMLPAWRDTRLVPIALVLLIAAGAVGAWNPWSNDWLFLAVRPSATRAAPMPLPTASRTYESPDLGALPPGPYLETLEEIAVMPSGAAADVGSAGAAVLLVLEGRVQVQTANGPSIDLGARGATLLRTGTSVRAINAGDRPARLLKFSVTPTSRGG